MLLSAELISWFKKIKKKFIYKHIDELIDTGIDYSRLVWNDDFDIYSMKDNFFVLSVDFAEGIGSDYTAINIFQLKHISLSAIKKRKKSSKLSDFYRLEQVGYYRDNNINVTDFAQLFYHIAHELFEPERIKIVFEVNDGRYKSTYDLLVKNQGFLDESVIRTFHSVKSVKKSVGIYLHQLNRNNYFTELKNKMAKRNFVIRDERTIAELTSFGLNKKGIYKSHIGNDDLGMTCVNAVSLFLEDDFKYFLSDYFEHLDKSYQDEISDMLDVDYEDETETTYLDYLKMTK